MFEIVELGQKLDRQRYAERVPELRLELVRRQLALREAGFPLIVVLSGDDRPSCHEMVNVLLGWLDPRHVETHAFAAPTEEEIERPFFWRYWRCLPARGRTGLFLRGWTMQPIVMRLLGTLDDGAFERWLGHVRTFEQALSDDGALVLKYWMHLPEAEFRKRVKAGRKKPAKQWQVGQHDPRIVDDYEHARALMERAIRSTSTAANPWQLVESTDERHRNVTVAEKILEALSARLGDGEPRQAARPAPAARPAATGDPVTVLDTVDLTARLEREDYEKRLDRWRSKLFRQSRKAFERGISAVLVFEGWDAAGKGGIIRRLVRAMDATLYRVVPIAAPTEEELAHHYLWRFWQQLPRAGHVTIFDRSWYGRVLVERVEGLADEPAWRRAYSEINDFEGQLVEHGVVLLKFWLHVDPDEQLRRFRERENTPFKQFKIGPEDYRNRERRNDYELAANEMIARTSTDHARWHLVPANDKRWARIEVLETVCRALARANKRAATKTER